MSFIVYSPVMRIHISKAGAVIYHRNSPAAGVIRMLLNSAAPVLKHPFLNQAAMRHQ
jgi:hypothetical protein